MPLSDVEARLAAAGLERNPDLNHLVRCVRAGRYMRDCQRRYFNNKNRENLKLSIDAEKKFDDLVAVSVPQQEGLGF